MNEKVKQDTFPIRQNKNDFFLQTILNLDKIIKIRELRKNQKVKSRVVFPSKIHTATSCIKPLNKNVITIDTDLGK
jgi:hypothetical protein